MTTTIVFRLATLILVSTAATAINAQPKESQLGDRIASFEMSWQQRRPEVISQRVAAVTEVMLGQRVRERPAVQPLIDSAGIPRRRIQIIVAQAPSLMIRYLPEYDELRIIDRELAASTTPAVELSQGAAMNVARAAFDGLAKRKILDPRHYNWEKADIASTLAGGGALDGKAGERKRIEYRITLRRELNGIEVANAGVRFAVHASGRLSGLRLGGVSIASSPAGSLERPKGRGQWLTRKVSASELQARFEKETYHKDAKPKVAWARVMYVMPETKRTAVVEPLYVVSYSLEAPSDEGQTVISRRKTVGYSLVHASASPLDLTPPVRAPKEDGRRKVVKDSGAKVD